MPACLIPLQSAPSLGRQGPSAFDSLLGHAGVLMVSSSPWPSQDTGSWGGWQRRGFVLTDHCLYYFVKPEVV